MPLEEQETADESPRPPVKADRKDWGDGLLSIYSGRREGEWIQVRDPSIEVDLADAA